MVDKTERDGDVPYFKVALEDAYDKDEKRKEFPRGGISC
jgi:hypothetical protein